jgi:hypothetical protein
VTTFHVPGPSRGTSATAKEGVSRPVSTPLEALSAGAFATDLTFEAVALEEFLTCSRLVEEGLVDAFTACVTARTAMVVVVGGGDVVVVTAAGVVVVGVIVVVDGDVAWRRGAELDDVVNVKTRTRSRSGLDQITQCVLFSE